LKFNFKSFYDVYRFIFVGIGAVTIDALVYFFLTFLTILSFEYSKRISFICGSVFAFYLNRNYVFKVKNKNISQYFSFSILYLFSFLMNSIAHDLILDKTEYSPIAFLIATALSTIINYLGQKFIVFKGRKL